MSRKARDLKNMSRVSDWVLTEGFVLPLTYANYGNIKWTIQNRCRSLKRIEQI